MLDDLFAADAEAVELEYFDLPARRRNAGEHPAKSARQRQRLAAVRAGHDDLARDTVGFRGRFLDAVMEIGEGAEKRFEHLPHAFAADGATVVLRVGRIKSRRRGS